MNYNSEINLLPALSFPTTVMLVDDDKNFNNSVESFIQNDKLSFLAFDNPADALEDIKNRDFDNKFLDKCYNGCEPQEFEQKIMSLNISDIHNQLYNKKRFEFVSTIIVDYDMPNMSGQEFLKQITQKNCRKVLLTGVADAKCAVDFFNEGLIDSFLIKEGYKSYKILEDICIKNHDYYFKNLSSLLYKFFSLDLNTETLVFESEYAELLRQIIVNYNIIEFYLLDSIGSMLLLDSNGKMYSVFFQNDDLRKSILQIGYDENLPKNLLSRLENNSEMLCYYNKNDPSFPEIHKWSKYFRQCKNLKHKSFNITWSLYEDPEFFQSNNIFNYNEYRR